MRRGATLAALNVLDCKDGVDNPGSKTLEVWKHSYHMKRLIGDSHWEGLLYQKSAPKVLDSASSSPKHIFGTGGRKLLH